MYDELWKKFTEATQEIALLKEANRKLTEENKELYARWDNLNREVKKQIECRAERVFSPTTFNTTLRFSVQYDDFVFNASNVQLEELVAIKAIEVLRYAIEEHRKAKRLT